MNDADQNQVEILLSLGSNLGNRKEKLDSALALLSDSGAISDLSVSEFYETEPYGVKDQPIFLNIVASAFTKVPLEHLISICKSIEYFLGRKARKKWHEREIDLDILLYGDRCSSSDFITVPHPEMHKRKFVLEPACDIVPNKIHPQLKKSMTELNQLCDDNGGIKKYNFK